MSANENEITFVFDPGKLYNSHVDSGDTFKRLKHDFRADHNIFMHQQAAYKYNRGN